MKLVDKIKSFENGPETLESFNKLFSECPIANFSTTDFVEIGECCSPETTRIVTINGNSFKHNFVPRLSDKVIEEEQND